jgi:hypothetical protein
MIHDPTLSVIALARNTPAGIRLLGTSVAVAENKLATALHVVGPDHENLVAVLPRHVSIRDWQDAGDPSAHTCPVIVARVDAFRDLCVLEVPNVIMKFAHGVGTADDVLPGSAVTTCGFPHANNGRFIQTIQQSSVGARVLLPNNGIKSKHIILNIQTQPGQSGSPVFDDRSGALIALVVGSYVPSVQAGVIIGGIDPRTLHQTTHAVSAEYIRDML